MTASVEATIHAADEALRDGRLSDAIGAYAQALAIDPTRSDVWYNRGWAERADRRFADALASYRTAINSGLARPQDAHLNRAAILSDHLFRPYDAIAELETALQLKHRFVPAWLSLGAIYEDLGDGEKAARAYQAALAEEPSNGRAHARLAVIAVSAGDARAAAERLRVALPTAPTVDDRADMLFALGTALDAQGLYDDAYQAVEAANWLARSVAATEYDEVAERTLVDRLIQTFRRPDAPAARQDDPVPVFICGLFRSGSTLAEQMLGRHSAVVAGGELEAVPAIARRLQPYPEAVPGLRQCERTALREQYRRERAAIGEGLVTDKRCDNYLHIGLIKTLFPSARIVHTVRHPLDTLLSAWFLNFGEGVSWGHDLREAARHYIQYRRLMAHWRTLWPDDIHDVSYDRMVADPQNEMGDLLAWLKLPWEDACLGDAPVSGPVRTASAWAVRGPISTRSSGRWRNYARYLDDVRGILADGGVEV